VGGPPEPPVGEGVGKVLLAGLGNEEDFLEGVPFTRITVGVDSTGWASFAFVFAVGVVAAGGVGGFPGAAV